jgi:hypothetical protein
VEVFKADKTLETKAGFKMELDLNATDFQTEWKRCNMLANYLADYTAYEYPRRELAENLFSTIINELLEAVARLAALKSVIRFALLPEPGGLAIRVDHEVQHTLASRYRDFVGRISHQVGESLYLSLLTEDQGESNSFNQLGLAMIVHDFGGRIEAEQRGDTPFMCTRVFIPTKELAS